MARVSPAGLQVMNSMIDWLLFLSFYYVRDNGAGDGGAKEQEQLMVTSLNDSEVDTHLALYQVSWVSDWLFAQVSTRQQQQTPPCSSCLFTCL